MLQATLFSCNLHSQATDPVALEKSVDKQQILVSSDEDSMASSGHCYLTKY
jgi:hypothetical protein